MENITKVWLGPLPADSPYVKPSRMYYVQNGVEKNWDLLKVHDSVAIVLFNTTRQKLVFVRQFRPAVFHGIITTAKGSFDEVDLKAFPPAIGVTLELCAGIVDKSMSWEEIAREEVLEECGYDVPVERIERVMEYRYSMDISGLSFPVLTPICLTDPAWAPRAPSRPCTTARSQMRTRQTAVVAWMMKSLRWSSSHWTRAGVWCNRAQSTTARPAALWVYSGSLPIRRQRHKPHGALICRISNEFISDGRR